MRTSTARSRLPCGSRIQGTQAPYDPALPPESHGRAPHSRHDLGLNVLSLPQGSDARPQMCFMALIGLGFLNPTAF